MPILIGTGIGALSRIVPFRRTHALLIVLRSMPATKPQGGRLQGKPIGERNGWRITPYGVPYIGCTPVSLPAGCASFGAAGLSGPRGKSFETNGIAIGLAIAICRIGSTAIPPTRT